MMIKPMKGSNFLGFFLIRVHKCFKTGCGNNVSSAV